MVGSREYDWYKTKAAHPQHKQGRQQRLENNNCRRTDVGGQLVMSHKTGVEKSILMRKILYIIVNGRYNQIFVIISLAEGKLVNFL